MDNSQNDTSATSSRGRHIYVSARTLEMLRDVRQEFGLEGPDGSYDFCVKLLAFMHRDLNSNNPQRVLQSALAEAQDELDQTRALLQAVTKAARPDATGAV